MSYQPITLATGTVTAGATIDVNIAAYFNLYTFFDVYFYGIIPANNNTNLLLRTSPDGTTFDAGASNYTWTLGFLNSSGPPTGLMGAGGASVGDTSIQVAAGIANTASIGTTDAKITLYNPGQTTNYKNLVFEAYIGNANSAGPARLWGTGQRVATTAVKGIRLLMSAGNITGNYIILGYK